MKRISIFYFVLLFGILSTCEKDPVLDGIIEQAMVVAEGKGIPSAAEYNFESQNAHPIVIIHKNGKNKKWNYDLSEEWTPAVINELELVVVVLNPEEDVIESCCYGWQSTPTTGFCKFYINRIQDETTIEIRFAKTGALVAQRTYVKNPGDCPGSATSGYDIHPKDLKVSEIADWLSEFVYGKYDLSKPPINIISPLASSKASGQVEIKVNVADYVNASCVKFSILRKNEGYGLWVSIGEDTTPSDNNEFSILWNTEDFNDGETRIRASAYNRSLYCDKIEWYVNVKNIK